MDKPWGPGIRRPNSATRLGDWDGETSKKELVKSRANTLGRYLKKIQPILKDKGITLEIGTGQAAVFRFRECAASAPPTAEATPADSAAPVNILQTNDQSDSQYLPTTLTQG